MKDWILVLDAVKKVNSIMRRECLPMYPMLTESQQDSVEMQLIQTIGKQDDDK